MTTDDLNKLLAEIEAACAAATPGPWSIGRAEFPWEGNIYDVAEGKIVGSAHQWRDQPANAHFIANARQWLPELVKIVREQEATIRSLTAASGRIATGEDL